MLRTVKFPFTVRTPETLATMTKLEWLVHRILSFTVHTHATLATMTKLEWLVHRILSFTVRTHVTLATMTKLEWLVHHILSFTVRTRDARNDDIHYTLCGARSGSPQLTKRKERDLAVWLSLLQLTVRQIACFICACTYVHSYLAAIATMCCMMVRDS